MKLAYLSLIALLAAGTARAEEPFQVLKPGDRDMACPAIATEVNALNQAAAQREEAALAKARRAEAGRKFLGFAANAAPMLAGRAGSIGGMYAAQAAMSAAQQGQTPGMTAQQADPASSPELARVDHLSRIYNEKSC